VVTESAAAVATSTEAPSEPTDGKPAAVVTEAAVGKVVGVNKKKRKMAEQQDSVTVKLRPRKRKTDKAMSGSAEKNISSDDVVTVEGQNDEDQKDDKKSHLHVFLPDLSGEEKLLSVLLSPYCAPDSEFKGKTALYVDDEEKYALLYSDFIRFKKDQYITDAVVNAFFWLLRQSFAEVYFAESFIFYWCSTNHHDDNQLRKIILKMWPDSQNTMFLPMNINSNHWILAVVNRRNKSVDVYDSLKLKNTKQIKLLCKKLDMVFNNNDTWVINNHCKDNIQRQSDSHSCAFFTCWYAYQLATGGSLETWATNISWKQRVFDISHHIFVSLVERKITMKV
jgi:Ulp1 family protease